MAYLRFFRAIDDVRPYGTHRYDVYGPRSTGDSPCSVIGL